MKRPGGSWIAATLAIAWAAAAACSPHSADTPRADASRDGAGQESDDDGSVNSSGDDATSAILEAGAASRDAGNVDDSPFVPDVALPQTACDADAADDAYASYCPPPLSTCADSEHLVYFDWGTCVSGQCVWTQKFITCSPYSSACSKGACVRTITAPLSP